MLAAFGAVGWIAGVRVNMTASLPVGLYVISRSPPGRGTLVLACLPRSVAHFAHERGYVPRGGSCAGELVPLGKAVVALPGDTVQMTPTGLMVNNTLLTGSSPLERDSRGRLLPRLPFGIYPVKSGELWLLSTASPRSFDSRYFGAISATNIRQQVLPLWTTESLRP